MRFLPIMMNSHFLFFKLRLINEGMERYFKVETDDTPRVELDKTAGVLTISGRSLPENAVAFYTPIFEWVKDYITEPNQITIFNFKFDYFNTASAKQITKLLLYLQNLAENHQVVIRWHYFKEDYDIQSSGARFAKLINAPIELIAYE
jgi:hypothetical protein